MAATAATFDDLLAPISKEQPAGEDITLCPEWQEIKEARRKHKVLDRQNADWPLIQRLLSQALAHKSKDLRLAVWLAEANMKLSGFGGLRDGIRLIRKLILNYWDLGLYPEMANGDPQFRANALASFQGDSLPRAIRQVAITARTTGDRDYSYFDFLQSRDVGWEKDLRNSLGDIDAAKESKRNAQLAAGAVSAEMFEEAVRSTRRAPLEAIHAELDEAVAEFVLLNEALEKLFKEAAPGTSDTKEALEDVRHLLDELLQRKRREEPDPTPKTDAEPKGGESAKTGGQRHWPGLPELSLLDGADGGGSWARAEDLISQGSIQEGLAEMTRLASQQCGRISFVHRLRLAEICLQPAMDRKRIAVAILEDLAKSIDELHLDKWETPDLLGRVWGRLYLCLKEAEPGSEQAARAKAFMDRLCKLDPWQALRWDE